jgi:hypothetical protein
MEGINHYWIRTVYEQELCAHCGKVKTNTESVYCDNDIELRDKPDLINKIKEIFRLDD